MSKAAKVLKFIGSAGPDGRSFTEIQKFIVTMNGLNWDKRDRRGRRQYRGYWTDYLLGNNWTRYGLLSFYCYKTADGRWARLPGMRFKYRELVRG